MFCLDIHHAMPSDSNVLDRNDVLKKRCFRYDLTDTGGVLEKKVLGTFHGLDD